MLSGIFKALASLADAINHMAAGFRRLGDVAHQSADFADERMRESIEDTKPKAIEQTKKRQS